MKPYPAIISWHDASRTDEAVDPLADIGVMRDTCGWVLRRDKAGVVVAFTSDMSDGTTRYERGFFIPAEYVRRVRRLT